MKYSGPWQIAMSRFSEDEDFVKGLDLFWDAKILEMLANYQICPGCRKIFPFAHISHVCFNRREASAVLNEKGAGRLYLVKPK